ncbi:MAG: hypothetical protein LUD72_06175 [Bacteroidales bacterium]|nr:hypothetical protein [Bacteroidales bacterium]
MLSRYRISRRQFLNPNNKVEITDVERETLLGADGEEYDLLRCYMDDVGDFNGGDTLLGVCEIPVMHTTYADRTDVFNFTDKMVITGISDEEKTINFYVNKYADLEINTIALQEIVPNYNNPNDTETWVYVYFFNSHYFSNPDLVTADEEESEDYNLLRAPIHLYIDYYDNNGALQTAKFIGDSIEYISITTLRISVDSFPDDLMTILFGDTSSLSPTSGITGDTSNLTFYRNAFKYSDIDFFSLFWDRPLQLMQIPLVQTFDTNMYQEDAMENFIADEEKKAIGTISDYEKDVYVPVTAGFEPVYKIIFNFHFREHRGDNWTVSSEGNWNGTMTNFNGTYDVLSLMGKSKDNKYAYFSYNKTDTPYDESFQSDLTSYLDFTNEDIRYQKNKVKKSFLRLSFYDSTNPASQNLLAYSTIFVDSGTLLTKYSKHFEDSPYSAISYDTDGDYLSTAQKLSGIRVNREPYNTMLPNSTTEDIEDVRLSSQLVVQDKYNSTSSSEGFYLYLWKSEDNGAEPRDIYMKAEFNHAGYGRTIPLMLPYWDYDDASGSRGYRRVKTFEEICSDWNIIPTPDDEPSIVSGYSLKTYLRYSYVRFKCQYDKSSKQYVYYPNVDVYNDMNDTIQHDANTLIFNLYEARMGEISKDTATRSYDYDCDSLEASLSFTYGTIPIDGGTVYPSLTWTMYATDKETGQNRTFTQDNTPNADVYYEVTYTDGSKGDATGAVTADATTETSKRTIAVVKAYVYIPDCDCVGAEDECYCVGEGETRKCYRVITAEVYQYADYEEYCGADEFDCDDMEDMILPCYGCGSVDESGKCVCDEDYSRTLSFSAHIVCEKNNVQSKDYYFDGANEENGVDWSIEWNIELTSEINEGDVCICPFGSDTIEHCKSVSVTSTKQYYGESYDDVVVLGTVTATINVGGLTTSREFVVSQYTAMVELGDVSANCNVLIPGDEGDSVALSEFELDCAVSIICGSSRVVIHTTDSGNCEKYGITVEYRLVNCDYAEIDGDRIVATATNDTGSIRSAGYLEMIVTVGDESISYTCDNIYQDVTSEIICDYGVPEIEIKEKSECDFGVPEIEIKKR